MTKPDYVHWCDGSEEEKELLLAEAIEKGSLEELNQKKLPGCYLHRSSEDDVARTEQLTFICTSKKEDAGPTNNWMSPKEAYEKLSLIFDCSMNGRTMYVIPFLMGPEGSPFSRVGVEITDSVYVVLNMRIMARMGKVALRALGNSNDFTRCLHGKADLNMQHRFICHFPEDNTIWSVGSAYGGNALLSKKCLALRIASYRGEKEGWLAEHMMIMGVEDPHGKVTYIAGAFPSSCGKTNLAMLVPPASMKSYKVWTVGDDIAWLHVGEDGRLWAINPEAGFFGVAPGTSFHTNPNAMAAIQKNTIFTNVLKTSEGTVWWEGMGAAPPKHGIDWRGHEWKSESGQLGAHPNSRFTAPAKQCPSISPEWENPKGVPISAILFGGRRSKLEPLVYETLSWQHGVYAGATMASETTAAATGAVGVVRRDPMAMLPFCGYNMGRYLAHWLKIGKQLKHPPKIFHVNWFRTDEDEKFLWPGFGDNLRVLKWVLHRCEGHGEFEESPIGLLPRKIDTQDLEITQKAMQDLFKIDHEAWHVELKSHKEFFSQFEETLPLEIKEVHLSLTKRFS